MGNRKLFEWCLQVFWSFSLSTLLALQSQAAALAVWDQSEETPASSTPKSLKTGYILPLFKFDQGKWQPTYDTSPIKKWTVTFDGKIIGTVQAKTSKLQPLLFLKNIQISEGTLPHPDQKTWRDQFNEPRYRPLVLSSDETISDPDIWKKRVPTQAAMNAAKKDFRANHKNILKCKKGDQESSVPWKYLESDIMLLSSYQSREGNSLIQLKLKDNGCDEASDDDFLDSWYAIKQKQKPILMGRQLKLIDAGDYNKDGKSEMLFLQLNQNGAPSVYVLFDQNFEEVGQRSLEVDERIGTTILHNKN